VQNRSDTAPTDPGATIDYLNEDRRHEDEMRALNRTQSFHQPVNLTQMDILAGAVPNASAPFSSGFSLVQTPPPNATQQPSRESRGGLELNQNAIRFLWSRML
jgi:hypothetical protein